MRHVDRFMWLFLGMLLALFVDLVGGGGAVVIVWALLGLAWLILEGFQDDAMQLDPDHLQRFEGVGHGDSPRDL